MSLIVIIIIIIVYRDVFSSLLLLRLNSDNSPSPADTPDWDKLLQLSDANDANSILAESETNER